MEVAGERSKTRAGEHLDPGHAPGLYQKISEKLRLGKKFSVVDRIGWLGIVFMWVTNHN